MRYFFIDYENVKWSGMNGLANLTDSDYVVVWYSQDAKTMPFSLHKAIKGSRARFDYIEVNNDVKKVKNALDVYLVAGAKKLVERDKNGIFIIISNDSDYNTFVAALKEKQIAISVFPTIEEACKAQPHKPDKSDRNANLKIDGLDHLIEGISDIPQTTSTMEKNQEIGEEVNIVNLYSDKENTKDNIPENTRLMTEMEFRNFFGQNLKKSYNAYKKGIIKAYLSSATKNEFHNNLIKILMNPDLAKEIYKCEAIQKNKRQLFSN